MPSPRVGVCSWSLQPADPTHLIDLLDSTGLQRLQLALSPILHDPAIWRNAIDHILDAGMIIESGMMAMAGEDYSSLAAIARTGGVRPDGTWPDNLAHARAIADLAASVNIDLVTFHAGFIPENHHNLERARLIERLQSIADIFAAHDITLGLETGQESAATLLDSLNDVDRPNLGVNFDPANMILYAKGDPVEAVAQLAPLIVQVHIKDAVPTDTPGTWGTEFPVGHGAVNWTAFFKITEQINPPVQYIIEREAGGQRLDDIRTAAKLIGQHTE